METIAGEPFGDHLRHFPTYLHLFLMIFNIPLGFKAILKSDSIIVVVVVVVVLVVVVPFDRITTNLGTGAVSDSQRHGDQSRSR